jgi:hypothetical protein
MDLVEHLNTYVSLLQMLFIFTHTSFDLAVTENSVLLLCSNTDTRKSSAENVLF